MFFHSQIELRSVQLILKILNVHLKNDIFSILLPLSHYCPYLASQFCNCMQNVVTSMHSSWDIRLKNP